MPTITNLKNYVWHANPTFTGFPSEQKDYDIHYHSDSYLFTHIVIKTNAIDYVRENPPSQPTAYSSSGWTKENYKTMRIVDGTDLENTELIALLEANGTLEPYVITLDLTTIGLAPGTYSIQTSASDDGASGLEDSDLSAPLQYTQGYNITVTATNCISESTNPRMINQDETAELHFTFDGTSYVCPETAPTVTGAIIDAWQKVDDTHGTLVISTATGAVSVTVEGEAAPSAGETWVINETPTLQPFVATYESAIFERFDCNVTILGGATYKYMTLGVDEWRPSVYRLDTIGFQNDPKPYPEYIAYSLGWQGPYPDIATVTFDRPLDLTTPIGQWFSTNARKQ